MTLTCTFGVAALLLLSAARIERPATASLGGRVTDTTARPLAGVRVELRHPYDGYIAEAKTDAEGNYDINGVHAGRYTVVATAEGYGCIWKPCVLLFEGRRANLDIVFTGLPRKVSDDRSACTDSAQVVLFHLVSQSVASDSQ